ncbi:LuxR C-terminal-related transcriptional regulator [Ahrensia sp. R2A130]|uniref:LuxR C-terminal-related transcriptional regulator n=1 Tax=Ahrensia sp. R2A130 TaxID=744979 RepID=UPI0001E0F858|nr:LuxR C-terminal-related transcriptional regulator [Ahrensia sp. R2A130]EFL89935.1 putative regulatory protein, LuxR [Ahrensia sp. R2A130]
MDSNNDQAQDQLLAGQLYDIALDPGALDTFVDDWNASGRGESSQRATEENVAALKAHLLRADKFLDRGEGSVQTDFTHLLEPFSNVAALVLTSDLRVLVHNDGAQKALGITNDDGLDSLPLDPTMRDEIEKTLRNMLLVTDGPDRILALDIEGYEQPVLFHLRRLPQQADDGQPMLLVVTTQHHWQPALGDALEEVFGLTDAEQGIVRALVAGQTAKTIAAQRGTSAGTVRGQIKSILSKTQAHSQSEIIRLVLSLQDVMGTARKALPTSDSLPVPEEADWLAEEVSKPFQTLTMPDGRRMDYHDQGPPDGAPVMMSHMGYCLVRWSRPMLKLAYRHRLRLITPMRAGYGFSDNIAMDADVMTVTREDTLFLMDHLGLKNLPYIAHGNDLIFAVDLAGKNPQRISEIVGVCARPPLPGGLHYLAMSKWHRFFLSTAKYSPHLLFFTAKAAVAMAKRIGVEAMFANLNRRSPADMRLLEDPETLIVLLANGRLIAGQKTSIAQAYAMELLQTEADWSQLMIDANATPICSFNGAEDPAEDVSVVAAYRESYPWMNFEVVPDGGQLLMYQHYEKLIPRFAKAAHDARCVGL